MSNISHHFSIKWIFNWSLHCTCFIGLLLLGNSHNCAKSWAFTPFTTAFLSLLSVTTADNPALQASVALIRLWFWVWILMPWILNWWQDASLWNVWADWTTWDASPSSCIETGIISAHNCSKPPSISNAETGMFSLCTVGISAWGNRSLISLIVLTNSLTASSAKWLGQIWDHKTTPHALQLVLCSC